MGLGGLPWIRAALFWLMPGRTARKGANGRSGKPMLSRLGVGRHHR
jgi:hypothetical protein